MGKGISRGSGHGDRCETEVRDLLKERSEGQELLDLSTLPLLDELILLSQDVMQHGFVPC